MPHYTPLITTIVAALTLAWAFAAVAHRLKLPPYILFTGKWNEGMRRFVIGVNRWTWRVTAYVYLLRDEYPPFSLD